MFKRLCLYKLMKKRLRIMININNKLSLLTEMHRKKLASQIEISIKILVKWSISQVQERKTKLNLYLMMLKKTKKSNNQMQGHQNRKTLSMKRRISRVQESQDSQKSSNQEETLEVHQRKLIVPNLVKPIQYLTNHIHSYRQMRVNRSFQSHCCKTTFWLYT